MQWDKAKYSAELVSVCGNYKITNFGKRGGNQYCLWESVKMNVNVATGKKKKPFEPLQIDVFSKLLTMGNMKHVRLFLDGERP